MHYKISFLKRTYEATDYLAMAFNLIFLCIIRELYPKTFIVKFYYDGFIVLTFFFI